MHRWMGVALFVAGACFGLFHFGFSFDTKAALDSISAVLFLTGLAFSLVGIFHIKKDTTSAQSKTAYNEVMAGLAFMLVVFGVMSAYAVGIFAVILLAGASALVLNKYRLDYQIQNTLKIAGPILAAVLGSLIVMQDSSIVNSIAGACLMGVCWWLPRFSNAEKRDFDSDPSPGTKTLHPDSTVY